MTATFLVAIDVDEDADLAGFAEQISEELTDSGYDVISCRPWDRAAMAMPQQAVANPPEVGIMGLG
jgi:hypothetical protein